MPIGKIRNDSEIPVCTIFVRKLKKKKREIARDARNMQRSNGGLSYSEAEKLDKKQDKLSREIYKQSTDNDSR